MKPIHAVLLDGRGGATAATTWEAPANGVLWLHLDQTDAEQAAWVRTSSGLDEVLVEALLAGDTRPRSLVAGDALFINLRGINVATDSEPEDMVALRMWFEAGRVITVRRRHVQAAIDVHATLQAGNGPVDAGDLLIDIVERLLVRIGDHVTELEDDCDELEEIVLQAHTREPRAKLADLRRKAIAIRRYLAPQRETIGRLYSERVTWLNDAHRANLRETGDRVTRYLETLDSTRERASVTSEELTNRLSEQMNQTLYVLSVITAIFLPLGLLTGLLGINVGGMPGTDSPFAFGIVTLVLCVMGLVEWMWFKRQQLV
ncbi:MAG: zinc transporter ZntB [Alphaproteobacteria bacterium]|nr:zinc transporter ZntB [Alphaproteobacteria bacterium]